MKTVWRRFLGRFEKNAETASLDSFLLLLVCLLAVFGTVMIFSASYAYAAIRYEDSFYFIKRQTIWLLLGFLVMVFASRVKMDVYFRWAPAAYIVTLALLLIVLLIGRVGNGAQRWIEIGPITIQPSEIAKTTLVLMLARYFSQYADKALDRSDKKHTLIWGTLIPFGLIGAVCLLVMLQKHLSGLIILGTIGILVIFLSGAGLRYIGYLCAGAGIGVACLALFTDYTKRRIMIWLNPEMYPLEGGWQTLQGLMAIGDGGLFGQGFGKSILKYSYVSEPANDMIYCIVCEELGLVGAWMVLALFAFFVCRGFAIGRRHPDMFSRLVALGITSKVAIQVLLNIAVVTNSIPNTGISLPFFSYGGSSLIMLFAEMGILLAASRGASIEK